MSQKDDPLSPDEMSERFAQLVVMQTQNILFSLGRLGGMGDEPHEPNFDIARVLIDQLEMLKLKTKGNLSPDESNLLDNALSNMRLVFVESVNLASGKGPAPAKAEISPPEAKPETGVAAKAGDKDDDEDDGGKKRFSKSYG